MFIRSQQSEPKARISSPSRLRGQGELYQLDKSDKTESIAFATINKTFLSDSEHSTKLSKSKPLKSEGFGELTK